MFKEFIISGNILSLMKQNKDINSSLENILPIIEQNIFCSQFLISFAAASGAPSFGQLAQSSSTGFGESNSGGFGAPQSPTVPFGGGANAPSFGSSQPFGGSGGGFGSSPGFGGNQQQAPAPSGK